MLAGELLLLQNAFKTDAKYRATHNPWVATGAALDGNCQCTRKANNHPTFEQTNNLASDFLNKISNFRTMCNMLAGELLLLQNAFKTDAKYRATHNPWVATGAALDGNCQCTRKANNHQSKCLLKS